MNEENNHGNFEIIVIGGGHAGIEAALISARLGKKVALITLDKSKIGFMPCNPSVGGSAKGIVVREIDALGGEMGKAADATALQFKLLGTSGGLATQALRVQSDKVAYARYMQKVVNKQENLTVIEGAVNKLLIKENKVEGVKLNNKGTIGAQTVILTTGTYLQPITYKGKESQIEGPDGEKKVVNNISRQLAELGFKLKRFKTGTSPRILTKTIDFTGLKIEPGTNLPLRFSIHSNHSNLLPFEKQLPCYLIHTNSRTHQIVRENSHLSPIFYKPDLGVGPRRCPSIEHKVCLFAEKEKHQVFLEPESRELDTTYLQGLSTSLPAEVQEQVLKTLPGLEKSQVKKWGYAIEYDVVDSTQLKISLETKLIDGLFTAGQINGTTGYEEAAAQGLIAGINASRKLANQEPLVLKRYEAYIGVLIDDLINSEEIIDPYRLLISSAEYSLQLRHDNAHTRLWEITYNQLGLLGEKEWRKFKKKQELQERICQKLRQLDFKTADIHQNFPLLNGRWKTNKVIKGYYLLKIHLISLNDFLPWIPEIDDLEWEEKRELEVNVKYEEQLAQTQAQAQELKNYEEEKIPPEIDYFQIDNLSKEAQEKLTKIKPSSLGQAMRIAGVNPIYIMQIKNSLRKSRR